MKFYVWADRDALLQWVAGSMCWRFRVQRGSPPTQSSLFRYVLWLVGIANTFNLIDGMDGGDRGGAVSSLVW